MSEQILGVVGWSGSGKTTLLEYLVSGLSAAGKTVNMVKHSHHDILTEPPHKDSARLRLAGAAEVLLASPYRYVITRELRQEAESSLLSLVSRMSAADVTLVEGYKWESIPKLEVHRPSLGKSALFLQDPYIVAVASDEPPPPHLPERVRWLNLNQPADILTWLLFALQQKLFLKNTENA